MGHGRVAHGTAPHIWRDRHARNAEAGDAERLRQLVALAGVGDEARGHVVEEPSPLVVVDEHGAAPELRRVEKRVGDLGHEGLAVADVAVGVLVPGDALLLAVERRVHEGDVGEVPAGSIGVEVRHVPDPRDGALSEQRGEREVGRVVAHAQPGRLGAVEDRLPVVAQRARRDLIRRLAARLRRPLVEAIRIRRPEERRRSSGRRA